MNVNTFLMLFATAIVAVSVVRTVNAARLGLLPKAEAVLAVVYTLALSAAFFTRHHGYLSLAMIGIAVGSVVYATVLARKRRQQV